MKRMVGMGRGASRLGAHIVLLSKTQTGFAPLDSFDLEVKGRNLTPPLPMAIAIHAVREKKFTLSADGKKLADQIVKRLSSDMKEQKETA